jgi:hypothetical protein
VGEQTIAYHSMTLDTFRYLIPQPTIFECYTLVGSDPEEWILGDAEGRIYSLSSQDDDFRFVKLGEVLVPLNNLTIVIDSVGGGIPRPFDVIHRIPFC